jgi:hypothetical protein
MGTSLGSAISTEMTRSCEWRTALFLAVSPAGVTASSGYGRNGKGIIDMIFRISLGCLFSVALLFGECRIAADFLSLAQHDVVRVTG